MPVDIAMVYDPARRCADLAWSGGDFALDTTPATAMLIAIGSDRRARSDDTLPQTIDNPDAPVSLTARRGNPGDALDPQGRRTGSRLWLMHRAKHSEAERQRARGYLAEAMDAVGSAWGVATQVRTEWRDTATLVYLAQAGSTKVQLAKAVGE